MYGRPFKVGPHFGKPRTLCAIMNQSLLKICFFLSLFACQGKGGGQWNVNKTIGWESLSPADYTILFLKLNNAQADSLLELNKKELDTAIIKTLRQQKLGDQAENDEPTEMDLHFIVLKNNEKALYAILSVVKEFNLQQQITVYRRDYNSLGEWTDKVVFPK
jgi:hypothetical protein